MGIDDVDRRFRPPKKIMLECECCEQPGPTVGKRESVTYGVVVHETVMCDDCWSQYQETQRGHYT